MQNLAQEITEGIGYINFLENSLRQKVLSRLSENFLTREENPQSHFCVYFLPFNPKTKEVFIVHHKKANKWLVPGGHIGKGENLKDVLNREIHEELGIVNFFSEKPNPFFFTIAPIEPSSRSCREHFDIWFLMQTDGVDFKLDMQEFYSVKWLLLDQALNFVTDDPNLRALKVLSESIK